jgi:hypothetical protein
MTQNRSSLISALAALFLLVAGFAASAQDRKADQDWKTEKRINILFGLSQPLLAHGFNIEANYIHDRLIIDYSHGVSLDFSGNAVPDALRRQGVAVHMPWTTGIGIGYRLTEWLNVRVEPKWHRFEFHYADEQKYSSNEILGYNSFTLGLGVYGSWRPFKKKTGVLSGLFIAPSVRYWPTVSSTLKGNSFVYFNRFTGANEEIKTYGPGIGLGSVIVNLSVGYSFSW